MAFHCGCGCGERSPVEVLSSAQVFDDAEHCRPACSGRATAASRYSVVQEPRRDPPSTAHRCGSGPKALPEPMAERPCVPCLVMLTEPRAEFTFDIKILTEINARGSQRHECAPSSLLRCLAALALGTREERAGAVDQRGHADPGRVAFSRAGWRHTASRNRWAWQVGLGAGWPSRGAGNGLGFPGSTPPTVAFAMTLLTGCRGSPTGCRTARDGPRPGG